jgi:uncharacterized protein (DUF305 family)
MRLRRRRGCAEGRRCVQRVSGLALSPTRTVDVSSGETGIIRRKLDVAFFLGIRQQAAIGDKNFLTAMIPHHAGAILMCERASIQDPEIKKLCGEIISSQQREIDQMKSMLARLI